MGMLAIFICSLAALLLQLTLALMPSSLAFNALANSNESVQSAATVTANPVNAWLQQLKERETALFLREQKNVAGNEELKSIVAGKENKLLLYLALTSTISLLLVIINFFLDHRRNRTS